MRLEEPVAKGEQKIFRLQPFHQAEVVVIVGEGVWVAGGATDEALEDLLRTDSASILERERLHGRPSEKPSWR